MTAAGLIAGLISVGSAAPAHACGAGGARAMLRSGAMETVALRTFHLEVEPTKKRFKVGEVAKIKVTVTRPAHEDPLGLGVEQEPPHSEPAEDVNVGMGLRIGDVFLFGHAITNEDGLATVKIKIKSYTPAGKANADAYAWKTVADTTCLKVEENGYRQLPNIFTIFRRG